tara:strand:+ start:848 stop:1072 length:225 start_codon:yes stop_codon:yes gene_type:complete
MSQPKEANLVSFKVVLTQDHKLITEYKIVPEDEVNKLFKDESENQIIKTVLRLGKNKLSNLHNLLQIELDVLND